MKLAHLRLTAGVLTLCVLGAQDSAADDQKRAALITFGPVTQSDWDRGNHIGWQHMIETTGMASSVVESVNYDQAATVLRRLAREGNDLIIASSAGYDSALLEVAPEYPDVMFVMFSRMGSIGDNTNIAEFRLNWNEVGYLTAAVSCLAKSADAKIGLVLSEPISAFTALGAGATQAANEHCPGGEDDMLVSWTRSFHDISRAKQASLAMIGQGAEVLFGALNGAFLGVVEAVRETNRRGQNAQIIMQYLDRCDIAPEACITSFQFNWTGEYERLGRLFVEGNLEAKTYQVWVQDDGVELIFPLTNVEPDVEDQVKDIIAQIKAGEIVIDPEAELHP